MASALRKQEFVAFEKIVCPSRKIALPFVMKDRLGLEICIRECQPGDRSSLASMYDQFEPKGIALGLPPLDKEVRNKWLDCIMKTFFNILATRRSKVIGHAAISLETQMVSPEYLIFLHQDFRRRGIGTRLTLVAKRICQELGCERLWVAVSTHNVKAIRFFTKLGFQFTGGMDTEREMVFCFSP